MSEHDKAFLEQVRQTLNQGVGELDGDSLNRLRQARLAATDRPQGRYRHRGWLMAGGAVASIALAVLISLQTTQRPVNESMLEDVALLSTSADLEMYRELDFYDWLTEKEQTGGV